MKSLKPIICHFLSSVSLFLLSSVSMASSSYLSDEPKPYLADDELVKRAGLLLEIGDPFLESGNIKPGFVLPTGAVWQPRLWVYGTGRSSVQSWHDDAGNDQTEWVNRLDLFANLQLSGTERILLGVQPLHRGPNFSGIRSDPEESVEEYNTDIRTLFFEGDFAELFPFLDQDDSSSNDIGFSIGRQPIVYQSGFIVNDSLDAFGVSRNNVRSQWLPWLSSLRISAVYAWGDVHRDNNVEDEDAELFGLFTQWDTSRSTINADLAYVRSQGIIDDSLWVMALDATQRLRQFNTTFRVAGSYAPQAISVSADNGVLIFSEVSWSPASSDNVVYINAFVGFENYRSAARDLLAGGPLGRTGVLFAARGIGRLPAALSNRVDEAAGLALGYQMFFAGARRQLLVEFGIRTSDVDVQGDSYGVAFNYQHALGRRYAILVNGFAASDDLLDDTYGGSVELLVKF